MLLKNFIALVLGGALNCNTHLMEVRQSKFKGWLAPLRTKISISRASVDSREAQGHKVPNHKVATVKGFEVDC